MPGHRATLLCALAAGIGAVPAMIVTEPPAFSRALIADVGAKFANGPYERTVSDHPAC